MAGVRILKSDGEAAGLRVFVAEDNAADLFWLEMVFKGARIPYTIELVQHGIEARDYLASLTARTDPRPDIIFLDMHLPGITAEEILDGLDAGFDIPIFLLSGSELPSPLRLRVGEERCLTKPLTNEQLFTCLSSAGLEGRLAA